MQEKSEDLRARACFIEQLPGIRDVMPANVVVLLDGLRDDHQWGPAMPSRGNLLAINQTFGVLPPEIRGRVLNGWPMPPDSWSREHANGLNESDVLCGYLTLMHCRHAKEIKVRHSVEFMGQSNSAVRVVIETGTAKKYAVAAVRSLLRSMLADWDDLVQVDEFGLLASKKESGTPQTSNAASPAKQSSERTALTTAA